MITARWRAALLAVWLAGTVFWVAIPAGSAGAGGRVGARLLAFAALALAGLTLDRLPPLRRIAAALVGLSGLSLLALLQSLSWPVRLVGWISPRHLELTRQAQELLGEPGAPPAATLSLAPDLSRSAALTLAATAALLVAAFAAGRRRSHRRWLTLALVGTAVVQVVYGLKDWLAGQAPRMHGTFVNPNHMAYLLEVGLALTFAWGVWSLRAQRRAERLDHRLGLVVPPVAVWLLLAVGLVWSGSRAGLGAAALGLLTQCLLWRTAVGATAGRRLVAVLGVAACGILALLAVRGADRLGETTVYELAWGDRAAVWRESLALWREFPATGTGLGTFGEGFPLVQGIQTTELYWRRAHNQPVELMATGGVAGLALGVLVLVGVARPLVQVLRRGWRSEDRAAGLAALGVLISVGAHELMDFGLTLPGIAWPVVVIFGAAAATRLRSGKPGAGPGRGAGRDGRKAPAPAGAVSRL